MFVPFHRAEPWLEIAPLAASQRTYIRNSECERVGVSDQG